MATEQKVKTSAGKETASQTVARAKAMLAQTKAEGSKPFKGSSYEKDYKAGKFNVQASPIVATDLNQQKEVALPPTPKLPDLNGFLLGNNVALGADQKGMFQQVAEQPAETTDNFGQIEDWKNKALTQIFGEMGTGADRYGALEKDAQIQKKQKAVNQYQSTLNSIVAQRDADVLRVEGQGRGIPDVIIGGQQYQINKEAAIRALPVQAQLAAAQNDLQLAQQYVDKMYQIQSQDALMQFQFKSQVIESIAKTATNAEQRRLDEVARVEERKYQEQQNFLKMQQSLLSNAFAQGAPSSVTSAMANATSTLDLISAAGAYNGDVLDRQLKLAQLAKLNEQTVSEVKAPEVKNINGVDMQWNPETGRWETISMGSTGLTPTQERQLATQSSTIDKIDSLLIDPGLNSSVGPTWASRVALTDRFGAKQNFIAGVENLIGQETLNTLINLKAQGGTLGALSDKELAILESTASKIATWRKKDDGGNITGYNVSERLFMSELESMKKKLQQARIDVLGYDPSLVPTNDSTAIDLYFNTANSTEAFNPASFY